MKNRTHEDLAQVMLSSDPYAYYHLRKLCSGDALVTVDACWLVNFQLPEQIKSTQLRGEPILHVVARIALEHLYGLKPKRTSRLPKLQSTCKCCNPTHWHLGGDPKIDRTPFETLDKERKLMSKWESAFKADFAEISATEVAKRLTKQADLKKRLKEVERQCKAIDKKWQAKLDKLAQAFACSS